MGNYDIIIIGAGPAGISSGIYALRAGVNVLVLDGGNSALKQAKIIQNYYGIDEISGEELLNKGYNQFKKLGGEIIKTEVLNKLQSLVTNKSNEIVSQSELKELAKITKEILKGE